jgi:hypothetical protein
MGQDLFWCVYYWSIHIVGYLHCHYSLLKMVPFVLRRTGLLEYLVDQLRNVILLCKQTVAFITAVNLALVLSLFLSNIETKNRQETLNLLWHLNNN